MGENPKKISAETGETDKNPGKPTVCRGKTSVGRSNTTAGVVVEGVHLILGGEVGHVHLVAHGAGQGAVNVKSHKINGNFSEIFLPRSGGTTKKRGINRR